MGAVIVMLGLAWAIGESFVMVSNGQWILPSVLFLVGVVAIVQLGCLDHDVKTADRRGAIFTILILAFLVVIAVLGFGGEQEGASTLAIVRLVGALVWAGLVFPAIKRGFVPAV